MTTKAAIRAWLNDPSSGSSVYHRSFANLCQALIWQIADKFGSPASPTVYSSAAAAMKASGTLNADSSKAPPGAIHYWAGGNLGTAGHDGLDLAGGGNQVIFGTTRAVAGAEDWGYYVKVGSVAAYTATGAHYAGWSLHNGTNTIPVELPAILPTQRRVGTDNVRRHTDASLASTVVAPPLTANTVQDVAGWRDGDEYEGSTVWFKVGDLWSHAETFTDPDPHDLSDLNPIIDPIPTDPVPADPPVDPDPPVPIPDPPNPDPSRPDSSSSDPLPVPTPVPNAPKPLPTGGIIAAIASLIALVGAVIWAALGH